MPHTVYGEIHAIPYNIANEALRYEIALLQHRAAATLMLLPGLPIEPEHDPQLDALSFYLMHEQRVISYAAVVRKQIRHADATFLIAGLSCVATDREYQGHGLGTRVVAAATRAIEASIIDIGIFTCDPALAGFYAKAGAWAVVPDVVLVGSSDSTALTSVALGKVVLMRLLSAKAQAAAQILRQSTISLDVPIGQFW